MKNSFLLVLACLVIFSTAGCKKKSDPEPASYATFTLKGVKKTYIHTSYFSKDLCSSSTFCCRFNRTQDLSSNETLKIGIPGDPIVGFVYYSGQYRFSCFYTDSLNTRYDLTTSLFTVVFTQWDGQGGWAKGYFSGWMRSPDNDSIYFENGYFQNKIWTMGTGDSTNLAR